jgi:Protein of unknown function (DUF4232)
LQWETPIPGLNAEEAQNVRITPAPPRCTDQQVKFTPGRTGAAGGSYYDRIIITNISSKVCSVYGYPGVEFVDGAGNSVDGPPDVRDQSRPKETVVLAPGGIASFLISGADSMQPGGTTPCPATRGVHVIVPGGYQPAFVPHVGMNCSNGAVRVYPVVAGRNAQP